jgi:dihydropteroate synthase
MGILNVTPDSFSDGGCFLNPAAAMKRARELIQKGADILDLGGESTRPGAEPVSEAEELRRVLPVLAGLAGNVPVPISIDTMKVAVARAAIAAGASFVNDVGANRKDGAAMGELVAQTGAGYICVHMQGTPQTMQVDPSYVDVVAEVKTFFQKQREALNNCGVRSEQIIFDPGIGFGKRIEHNLALLRGLTEFVRLDRPLLLGVSRKSFLGKLACGTLSNRLAPGLACACIAVAAGVRLIRTHDVAETVQAVRMTEAVFANRTE